MGLMFPIYFISFVLSSGMTLCSFYQIIELSDLDCDYTNPQTCCANLNKLVIPELICVGMLVSIHILTLNWLPVATTLPMLTWLIYMYRSTSSQYVSLYDIASIRDETILKKHVRHCVFKIAFHIIHLLAYMYFAVVTLQLA